MRYTKKQLQVFQVIEQYESLVRDFLLSKAITETLCFGQVSDYKKLEKYCESIRTEMKERDGVVFRNKKSTSFAKPELKALAHDAILIYQQCNSRNKDLDFPITADELLFVCRRLQRKSKGEVIYADRVYTSLMMFSSGMMKINRCNKCNHTFAAKVDNNTQSNCTNCFTMKKCKSVSDTHSNVVNADTERRKKVIEKIENEVVYTQCAQ